MTRLILMASAEQRGEKLCNVPQEQILEMPEDDEINLLFTGYILSGVSQVDPKLILSCYSKILFPNIC